jgi:hypothetical protein
MANTLLDGSKDEIRHEVSLMTHSEINGYCIHF